MRDRTLSQLSLAAKAGKALSGEAKVHQSIRDGSAYLVIVAGDASENTKKRFRNAAEYYRIPFLEYADRETLGRAIGEEFRSAAAVTDEGLAGLIRSTAASSLQWG